MTFYDNTDPYAALDPYQSDYTTDPSQLAAMMDYLSRMDPKVLKAYRNVASGAGTNLTNEGKLLTNQGKVFSNNRNMINFADNPLLGLLTNTYDPMALQQQQAPPPFEATYSPLRQQWGNVNTPDGQAVNALYDAIDQGQDPYTLVSQATSQVGGAMDQPLVLQDGTRLSMTGKDLLRQAQDYQKESTARATAAAQAQYAAQSAPNALYGSGGPLQGIDPTLGSFTDPYIQPSEASPIVDEYARKAQAAMQARLQYMAAHNPPRAPADTAPPAGGGNGINWEGALRTAAGTYGNPSPIQHAIQGSLPGAAGWLFGGATNPLGTAVSGLLNGLDVLKRGKRSDVSVSAPRQGSSSGGQTRYAPPQPEETPQQFARAIEQDRARLTSFEDRYRASRGLPSRDTGQSIGQHNLMARLRFLGMPVG